MGSNYFNYTILHANISTSYELFEKSHNFFFDENSYSAKWINEDSAIIQKNLRTISSVEHEFFHCRNFLSSTFGFFLYLLSAIDQDRKEYLLESLASRRFLQSGQRLSSFEDRRAVLKLGSNEDFFDHYFLWRDLRNLVLHPSTETLSRFQAVQRSLIRRGKNVISLDDRLVKLRLEFPNPPVVRNIKSIKKTVDKTSAAISNIEIIEGLALWREHQNIVAIVVAAPNHLKVSTAWLYGEMERQPVYSRALDAIRSATGCDIGSALPGAMLDIAMNGAFFSSDPQAIEDLLPNLRLAQMLDQCGQLPGKFKLPLSIESVGNEFYEELSSFFSNILGWQKLETNLKEAIEFARADAEESFQFVEGPLNETLNDVRRICLRPFYYAMKSRLLEPAVFLFRSDSELVQGAGYLSQPLATSFSDQLNINLELRDKPTLMYFYLHKLLTVSTTTVIFNSLGRQKKGAFEQSKRLAKLIASRLRQESELDEYDIESMFDFNNFMSQWLKLDWDKVCDEIGWQ